MTEPATGTVTFLFTDIEGSTELSEAHPTAWESLRRSHDELLQAVADACGGFVFKRIGDALCIAFATAHGAVRAAIEGQRRLQSTSWSPAPLRVRMGLHTGVAEAVRNPEGDLDYVGHSTLARVQRIMSAASGEQVLLSQACFELLRARMPDTVVLQDIGRHRLKGFAEAEQLYQAHAAGLRSAFPALSSPGSTANNLPTSATRFIGRTGEIDECRRLLAEHRLVTLTAIGGAGKTRLATEVARESLPLYPDGVWFIDLARVTDNKQVLGAIALSLGLREQPDVDVLDTIVAHLRPRTFLLLLDNCEHVLDAVRPIVDTLLAQCKQLTILATSREGLGVPGEQKYAVPMLALPTALDADEVGRSDAVAMFVDRAHLADPSLVIDAPKLGVVVDICRHLDGIALAIELAAARVSVLRLDDIRARLADRFRLLTGGSRTLPRQQTLRTTLQWSFDLLAAGEQRLLLCLGVFVGGWTLQAATAVAGVDLDEFEVLETLTRLVDKSLIALDRDRGPESRYSMLETVRQFALERIDPLELDATRRRHALFFVALADQWHDVSEDWNAESAWFARMDADHENVLAAHEMGGLAPDLAEPCLRLAGSALHYWEPKGMLKLAYGLVSQSLQRDCAALAGCSRGWALSGLSHLAPALGKYEEGLRACRDAEDIARAIEDERLAADIMGSRMVFLMFFGQLTEARNDMAAYCDLAHRLGGRRARRAQSMKATLLYCEGNLSGAEDAYLEALREARAAGFVGHVTNSLINLGWIAARRGDAEALRERLFGLVETGFGERQAGSSVVVLELFALYAALSDSLDLAVRFHGAARGLAARIDFVIEPGDAAAIDPIMERVRSTLGAAKFEASVAGSWNEDPVRLREFAVDWLKAT